MSIEYRVLKHVKGVGDIYYAVHEVYFGENEKVVGFSDDPIFPWGEDMTELEVAMRRYNKALDSAVLLVNDDGSLQEVDE
jgi:hypothetical protein